MIFKNLDDYIDIIRITTVFMTIFLVVSCTMLIDKQVNLALLEIKKAASVSKLLHLESLVLFLK